MKKVSLLALLIIPINLVAKTPSDVLLVNSVNDSSRIIEVKEYPGINLLVLVPILTALSAFEFALAHDDSKSSDELTVLADSDPYYANLKEEYLRRSQRKIFAGGVTGVAAMIVTGIAIWPRTRHITILETKNNSASLDFSLSPNNYGELTLILKWKK